MSYALEIALAKTLIASKGRDIGLITMTPSGDAWDATNSTATQTVKAVQTSFNHTEITSGLVSAGDVKYLVASTIEPTTAMKISDNSKEYSIKSVEALKPGADVILYKVHAGG